MAQPPGGSTVEMEVNVEVLLYMVIVIGVMGSTVVRLVAVVVVLEVTERVDVLVAVEKAVAVADTELCASLETDGICLVLSRLAWPRDLRGWRDSHPDRRGRRKDPDRRAAEGDS